jgi:pimeloyl-ACP methyl ester carboxylesterase
MRAMVVGAVSAVIALHAMGTRATVAPEGRATRLDMVESPTVRRGTRVLLAPAQHSSASTGPVGNKTAYDPLRSMQLMLHSDAAYCGDDVSGHGSTASIANWSCPPCRNSAFEGVRVELVGVAQGGGRDAFAYVAIQDDDVVVSFRGTVLNKDFLDDANAVLRTWPGPLRDPALVHSGFVSSYESLVSSGVVTHLSSALRRVSPQARVFLTGHSLGAAQASLAAVDLPRRFPGRIFELVSFGSPMVGNRAFADQFASSPGLASSWRVTHRNDSVPHLPPPLIFNNYHHVEREVWYKDPDNGGNESLQYVICDGSGTDPLCSASVKFADRHDADHDVYLDHAMYCCEGAVASSKDCAFPFPDGPKLKLN